MESVGPSWVIVETKPSSEEIAERSLRQAGYRTYLPRYRKLLAPHGQDRRPATAMRPLFARLVLVQDWRGWPHDLPVSGTLGLMKAWGGTAKLSDADVSIMCRREMACEFDQVQRPRGGGVMIRDDLKPGDEVEIEAFGTRVLGSLVELSDNGKAVVSAMLFGRAVRTEVDAETLHAVNG